MPHGCHATPHGCYAELGSHRTIELCRLLIAPFGSSLIPNRTSAEGLTPRPAGAAEAAIHRQRGVAETICPASYAGAAAEAVKPMASAYFRYVSTEAITTRASIESSSIPTRDTLAQASITMPLSRIRSTTSARLEESVDFCTFAMKA